MKVVLVFVSTLDGKITKWGDSFIRAWSSREDQDYFTNLWNTCKLIVMGSNTFNAEPVKPSPNRHIVVTTRNPSLYKNLQVDGQLDFRAMSPGELVAHYEKEGHNQLLLVGGASLATSFFKEQLINEVWLTIEPRIFGDGGSFVSSERLDIALHLLSIDRVNEEGTLITKYQVVKK